MEKRYADDLQMKLFDQNGVSFALAIDGYQYPEIADDYWDSNWLFVRGEVRYPSGGWTFREPCLTTVDLRKLADWLDSIARGRPRAARCSFDEPNLVFEYQSDPRPGVVIRFAHESAPTWQGSDERLKDFSLSFDVFLNDLAKGASDLREFLVTFPERGNRDTDVMH